jgi:glycosyltransferase involved in cell wall biosynthesis
MLQKIVRFTDKSRYCAEIISLNGIGVVGQEMLDEGMTVHSFSLKSWKIFFSLIALARLLRTIKPDIVQTWMYHGDFFGGVLAKICTKAKIIWGIRVTLDGKNLEQRSTWVLAYINALLSHFIPDVIISNSVDGRDSHIRSGYARKKFVLVPNGFETERYQFDKIKRIKSRTEWQIGDGDFVIGMAGRYVKQKDWLTFFKLIADLCKHNPNIKAVVCGSKMDNGNPALGAVIDELQIRDRIVMLGPISNMIDFYCGLDLFALTSIFEGFPNVVGEALAIGLPCVVTNAGECRELVEACYVAPCGAVSALSAMCQRIIDMDDLQLVKYKSELAHSLRARYDIKNIVQLQQEIYDSLVHG